MSTSRHVRISDELRARILRRDFDETAGKLPSEAELIREFGVSRTTVRTALTALMNEGFVRSESGVGYFVRELRRYSYRPQDDMGPRPADPKADHFLSSSEGLKPSQEIEVRFVPAPGYVAERMGISTDEFVGMRQRVRFLDGVPYQINDSYYPRDIVEGTVVMDKADIARGVNRVLDELGHKQVRALDEIYIRMPYRDEAETLTILPGTPVAVHIVTGYTAGDRAVRVVRTVLPGDRHVIAFERGDVSATGAVSRTVVP